MAGLPKVLNVLRLPGWSVGARLLLINGLLMVALVVVTVIAWRALSAQSRAMTELALISKAARYHQDADTVHANLRADVSAALVSGTLSADERSTVADSLAANAKDFRRDLLALEHFELAPDLVETETKVRTLADTFLTKAMEIGPLALRDSKAAEGLLPELRAAGDALDAGMLRQTAAFTEHITQATGDAASAEANAKRWLITAGILTSVVGAMLVAWLSRSIRGSLRRVRDVAVTISEGNLGVRSVVSSRDELGELGHAINAMADRLNEVIGRLRAEADRDAFGTQLVEALEMADTEEEVYRVLARGASGEPRRGPRDRPSERAAAGGFQSSAPGARDPASGGGCPGVRCGVSFQLHGGATGQSGDISRQRGTQCLLTSARPSLWGDLGSLCARELHGTGAGRSAHGGAGGQAADDPSGRPIDDARHSGRRPDRHRARIQQHTAQGDHRQFDRLVQSALRRRAGPAAQQ